MIIELIGGPFDGQQVEVGNPPVGPNPGISMPSDSHPVKFSHYKLKGDRAVFWRTVTVEQIFAEKKAAR